MIYYMSRRTAPIQRPPQRAPPPPPQSNSNEPESPRFVAVPGGFVAAPGGGGGGGEAWRRGSAGPGPGGGPGGPGGWVPAGPGGWGPAGGPEGPARPPVLPQQFIRRRDPSRLQQSEGAFACFPQELLAAGLGAMPSLAAQAAANGGVVPGGRGAPTAQGEGIRDAWDRQLADATGAAMVAPVHYGLPKATIELFVPTQIAELNALVEKLVDSKLIPIISNIPLRSIGKDSMKELIRLLDVQISGLIENFIEQLSSRTPKVRIAIDLRAHENFLQGIRDTTHERVTQKVLDDMRTRELLDIPELGPAVAQDPGILSKVWAYVRRAPQPQSRANVGRVFQPPVGPIAPPQVIAATRSALEAGGAVSLLGSGVPVSLAVGAAAGAAAAYVATDAAMEAKKKRNEVARLRANYQKAQRYIQNFRTPEQDSTIADCPVTKKLLYLNMFKTLGEFTKALMRSIKLRLRRQDRLTREESTQMSQLRQIEASTRAAEEAASGEGVVRTASEGPGAVRRAQREGVSVEVTLNTLHMFEFLSRDQIDDLLEQLLLTTVNYMNISEDFRDIIPLVQKIYSVALFYTIAGDVDDKKPVFDEYLSDALCDVVTDIYRTAFASLQRYQVNGRTETPTGIKKHFGDLLGALGKLVSRDKRVVVETEIDRHGAVHVREHMEGVGQVAMEASSAAVKILGDIAHPVWYAFDRLMDLMPEEEVSIAGVSMASACRALDDDRKYGSGLTFAAKREAAVEEMRTNHNYRNIFDRLERSHASEWAEFIMSVCLPLPDADRALIFEQVESQGSYQQVRACLLATASPEDSPRLQRMFAIPRNFDGRYTPAMLEMINQGRGFRRKTPQQEREAYAREYASHHQEAVETAARSRAVLATTDPQLREAKSRAEQIIDRQTIRIEKLKAEFKGLKKPNETKEQRRKRIEREKAINAQIGEAHELIKQARAQFKQAEKQGVERSMRGTLSQAEQEGSTNEVNSEGNVMPAAEYKNRWKRMGISEVQEVAEGIHPSLRGSRYQRSAEHFLETYEKKQLAPYAEFTRFMVALQEYDSAPPGPFKQRPPRFTWFAMFVDSPHFRHYMRNWTLDQLYEIQQVINTSTNGRDGRYNSLWHTTSEEVVSRLAMQSQLASGNVANQNNNGNYSLNENYDPEENDNQGNNSNEELGYAENSDFTTFWNNLKAIVEIKKPRGSYDSLVEVQDWTNYVYTDMFNKHINSFNTAQLENIRFLAKNWSSPELLQTNGFQTMIDEITQVLDRRRNPMPQVQAQLLQPGARVSQLVPVLTSQSQPMAQPFTGNLAPTVAAALRQHSAAYNSGNEGYVSANNGMTQPPPPGFDGPAKFYAKFNELMHELKTAWRYTDTAIYQNWNVYVNYRQYNESIKALSNDQLQQILNAIMSSLNARADNVVQTILEDVQAEIAKRAVNRGQGGQAQVAIARQPLPMAENSNSGHSSVRSNNTNNTRWFKEHPNSVDYEMKNPHSRYRESAIRFKSKIRRGMRGTHRARTTSQGTNINYSNENAPTRQNSRAANVTRRNSGANVTRRNSGAARANSGLSRQLSVAEKFQRKTARGGLEKILRRALRAEVYDLEPGARDALHYFNTGQGFYDIRQCRSFVLLNAIRSLKKTSAFRDRLVREATERLRELGTSSMNNSPELSRPLE